MTELDKIQAETAKFHAETLKLQKEIKYYPMISIIISLIALLVALIK